VFGEVPYIYFTSSKFSSASFENPQEFSLKSFYSPLFVNFPIPTFASLWRPLLETQELFVTSISHVLLPSSLRLFVNQLKEKRFNEEVKFCANLVSSQGLYGNAYFAFLYKFLYGESVPQVPFYMKSLDVSPSSSSVTRNPLISLISLLFNILDSELRFNDSYFSASVLTIIGCLFSILDSMFTSPVVNTSFSFSVEVKQPLNIPSFTVTVNVSDILYCLIFPRLYKLILNILLPFSPEQKSSVPTESVFNSASLIRSSSWSIDRNSVRLAVLLSLDSLQLPYSFGRSLYGEWFTRRSCVNGAENYSVPTQSVYMTLTSALPSFVPSDRSLFNSPVHLYYFYDSFLSILMELVNVSSFSTPPLVLICLSETCIELLSKLDRLT
jgi:hypothetical protein